jgi:hypothetical protein
MLSYSGTGATTSGEQKVTKAISGLIITSTLNPNQIVNENISIWIERPNRENVVIATSLKLIDYLTLTNFFNDAIQSEGVNQTIAYCELSDSENGAVILNEGDSLKYKLDALVATESYAVYTIEDAQQGSEFYAFERKTFASEDLVRTQNVERAELGCFNLDASITQISLKYANGITVKYLPFELKTIARDVDPIYYINPDDSQVWLGHSNRLTIPLVGVSEIEIVKNPGTLIELITLSTKDLNEF